MSGSATVAPPMWPHGSRPSPSTPVTRIVPSALRSTTATFSVPQPTTPVPAPEPTIDGSVTAGVSVGPSGGTTSQDPRCVVMSHTPGPAVHARPDRAFAVERRAAWISTS